MKVPFLDLKRMDEKLKNALKSKFEEMLEKGIFSGGEEVEDFESQITNYLHSPVPVQMEQMHWNLPCEH